MIAKTAAQTKDAVPWETLPHTESMATNILRFSMRVIAATHHYLRVFFQGYPYRLVQLLRRPDDANEDLHERCLCFLSAPVCVLDSFSRTFREHHSSVDSIASEDGQQALHLLMKQLDLSTYSTERLHSKNARRVHARVWTHELHLHQASVASCEGIPLFARKARAFQSSAASRKRAREDVPDTRPKKR